MATTNVERITPAEVKISVTLEPSDYRDAVAGELKKLAKSAKIKGFRPGKVPASYMKKMYGRSVFNDVVNKKLDEAINELIKAEDLQIFGQLEPVHQPDPEQLDADTKETLEFEYEGGLMPSIEEVDLSGLKNIKRYRAVLTDEELDQKLGDAITAAAELEDIDRIETEEDYATLVLADVELDEKLLGAKADAHDAEPGDEGEHVDAEENNDSTTKDERQRYFLQAKQLIEAQRNKLVEKAIGTEIILSINDLNEEARPALAGVLDDDGATKSFTLIKAQRRSTPERTPELYKKIFGQNAELNDDEEAKTFLSSKYSENSQSSLDGFIAEQVADQLIADNEIAVPEKAIIARIHQARREEAEAAAKEEREPNFDHEPSQADVHSLERRLRWVALRNNLIKKYELRLEEEDYEAALDRLYVQQIAAMGIDPEQYREQFYPMFKQNFFKDRDQAMQLSEQLLSEKLIAKLEEKGVLGGMQDVTEAEFGEISGEYNKNLEAQYDELRKQKLAASEEE